MARNASTADVRADLDRALEDYLVACGLNARLAASCDQDERRRAQEWVQKYLGRRNEIVEEVNVYAQFQAELMQIQQATDRHADQAANSSASSLGVAHMFDLPRPASRHSSRRVSLAASATAQGGRGSPSHEQRNAGQGDTIQPPLLAGIASENRVRPEGPQRNNVESASVARQPLLVDVAASGSAASSSRVNQWLSDMSVDSAEEGSLHHAGVPSMRVSIAALTQLVQNATMRETPRAGRVGHELGQRLAERMMMATGAWDEGIAQVRREAASAADQRIPAAPLRGRQGASTPANPREPGVNEPARRLVSDAQSNRTPVPTYFDAGRTPGGYRAFYEGIRDNQSRVRFWEQGANRSAEETYTLPPSTHVQPLRAQEWERVPFQATLGNLYRLPNHEFDAIAATESPSVTTQPRAFAHGMLSRFPRLEVEPFDGDVTKWFEFAASFKQCVHDVVPDLGLRMTYLRKFLTSTVRARFQHLLYDERCYYRVLDALEFEYGRPELVARIHLAAIEAAPSCSEGDYSRLLSLSRKLNEATACLTNIGCVADLCSQTLLGTVARKLPPTLRLEWGREARRRGGTGALSVLDFVAWLREISLTAEETSLATPKAATKKKEKKPNAVHNVQLKEASKAPAEHASKSEAKESDSAGTGVPTTCPAC